MAQQIVLWPQQNISQLSIYPLYLDGEISLFHLFFFVQAFKVPFLVFAGPRHGGTASKAWVVVSVCFTTTPSRNLIIRYMISYIPMIWYPMTNWNIPRWHLLEQTMGPSIIRTSLAVDFWQVLGPISYGWSCHPAAVGVSCAPSKACQRPNLISSKWYRLQCPWHPEVIDTFDPKNKQEAGDLE